MFDSFLKLLWIEIKIITNFFKGFWIRIEVSWSVCLDWIRNQPSHKKRIRIKNLYKKNRHTWIRIHNFEKKSNLLLSFCILRFLLLPSKFLRLRVINVLQYRNIYIIYTLLSLYKGLNMVWKFCQIAKRTRKKVFF